jgi:uncharacterized protein YkwD
MKLIPAGKSLLVGAVAVGALSLGTAGIAGAATPSSVPSTPSTPAAVQKFNCADASKVLNRINKVESRITAGLPKLTAAEAKATAAGNTRRADRIKKAITHLESTTLKNRLTKASVAIETKCDVPATSAS